MATESSVCGGGGGFLVFHLFFVDDVDGWGSAFPLPPLPAFPALWLLGGGEGLDVFFLLAGSLSALTVDFNRHMQGYQFPLAKLVRFV